jgi:DNA sulfur modification protein DndD
MQRAALSEETIAALQNVHDEFTAEIKHKISEEANKYFMLLLDVEGRETLKEILVNDDYSLQVHDRWGKPFLANISAGQRQIMSISFIAALARIAAADNVFEMPFFMDTPFGRLSSEHRRNLVEKVPTFCAQWVLQGSRREAALLRRSGKWEVLYTTKRRAGVTKLCVKTRRRERNFGKPWRNNEIFWR